MKKNRKERKEKFQGEQLLIRLAILGKSGVSITLTLLPKLKRIKTSKMPRLTEQIGLLMLQRPV